MLIVACDKIKLRENPIKFETLKRVMNCEIEMETKTCTKCNVEQNICNYGKSKPNKDGLHNHCKACRKAYRVANEKHIASKNKAYYIANKTSHLESSKKYRECHKEEIYLQRKEYRSKHQEHIKEKNKEYLPTRKQKIKERRKTDKNFQISEIIRSKVHKMLRGQETSYKTLIGCDIETLKSWLEFQFDEQMTWANLGDYWQIDHILAINQFDFQKEDDKRVCFNWTNLQPLITYENRSKSDKLLLHYYFNSVITFHRFIKVNKLNITEYQNVRESLHWLREKLRYGKNLCDGDNSQPSLHK